MTTLSEALRNVPGITLQAGEGGGASSTAGDMFNMRGFNASNSLFVDNVRDDGLMSRDVFNLEQVEVFMGPTGSDVGRGTAAGYVNMQTKTPHLPRVDARRRSPSGPPKQRRGDDRHQPAALARRADSWIEQVGGPVERAVAGQRRRRPRRGARTRRKAFAPSLGLGLGTPTPCPRIGAGPAPATTCPTTAFPAPPGRKRRWRRRRSLPSTPVDQSNYYGSPAYDYDNADQNTHHGARRARLHAAMDGVQSDPLQQDGAGSGHQHGAVGRVVRAGDRPGDDRPPGQRAREPDHVEPDES